MVIIITNVNIAAIGFANEKKPPPMDIAPIIMLIMREPFDNCFTKTPSIIFEMPTIIKAMPRSVTKNNVVTSGLAKTATDNPIAMPPRII